MFRQLALPFLVPAFLWAVAGSLFLPVLPQYARALGAGVSGVGLVVAMYSVGALIASFPAGRVIHGLGAGPVMKTALFVETIAAGAAAFAPNAMVLGGALAVMGAGNVLFFIARLTHFRTEIPANQRARWLTVLAGEFRIGSALGPIIGGFLAGALGFTPVFLGTAVFAVLAFGFTAAFLRPTQPRAQRTARTPAGIGGVPIINKSVDTGSLWRTAVEHRRVFATAGVALLLLRVMREARRMLFPLFGDAMGLDPGQIGVAFSAAFVIESVLFIPVGVVMDRFGRKYTAIPCMVVLAGAFAALPFVSGFAGYLVLLGLSGLGNGLGAGIDMTMSTDFAPRDNAARFLSVWRIVGELGGVAGPALVGAIAAATSFGVSALFVAALGFSAAVITVTLVPEPLHAGSGA